MSDEFMLSLISGASAGAGVDLILFPLDTIKTRIQNKNGFWRSGGLKGIYNGIPSTLVFSAPTAAVFFTTYDTTKTKLAHMGVQNATLSQIVAANCGETIACLIRVPADNIRQRAQVSSGLSTFSIFKQILKNEGFKGFYRSYLTTVFREIPFGSIQFPLWEYLKVLVARRSGKGTCEPYQSAICGAVAGGFSAALTTPIDVAKTRITLASKKNDLIEKQKIVKTIQEIYSEKGVRGLFAGVYPRVTMISMGGFIFFGIYEETRKLLASRAQFR